MTRRERAQLSKPQQKMMRSIAQALEQFDGLAPHMASEYRTLQSLIEKKLVRFVAFGECGEGCERAGECPHSVEIYTFTDEGKRYMEKVQP
jgi:hypothetical protein